VVEANGDPLRDTDGDGVIDSLDLDADNDGLLDLLESGQEVSEVDTNGDGILDSSIDSDNDGLMDVADLNDNDPTSIGNVMPLDTDGDDRPDFQDLDSDNDGLSDLIEATIPAENDGNNDGMIDGDVDSLGIPNLLSSVQTPLDTDQDGLPNYRDLDSDNDGLTDLEESGVPDLDNNGIVDTLNSLTDLNDLPDQDGNGIIDVQEPNNDHLPALLDEDQDGVIDGNEDQDQDGILDVVDENDNGFGTRTVVDSDGDGIPNEFDLDDDNDGITDDVELQGDPSRDTDEDGIIDSLDLDSDNDGLLDLLESGQDINNVDLNEDGILDSIIDNDHDGLMDTADLNDSDASSHGTVIPVDTDEDEKPDFQDVDSDNDGLSDLVEAGIQADNDADSDGMIDGDVSSYGIPTRIEPLNQPLDTDGDNLPNYRDLDSDNDGIYDVIEIGAVDEDGDGKADTEEALIDGTTLPDSNDNEIPDVLEPNGISPVSTSYTPTSSTLMSTPLVEENSVEEEEAQPEPTSIEEPEVMVEEPTIELRDNVQAVRPGEVVSIDLLENDEGDIDPASLILVVPETFTPEYQLSEDGKNLVVEGEGTWTLEENGILTFTPTEGFEGDPTDIAYRVLGNNGSASEIAAVSIYVTDVAGVSINQPLCQTSDSVPAFGRWGLLVMIVMGALLGLLLARREKIKTPPQK